MAEWVRQLVKEKENSELKPVKLRFKIDIVSFPARAEGLVNRLWYPLSPELSVKQYNCSCFSRIALVLDWLVGFNGISTSMCYPIPEPFYTYILYI